MKYIDADKLKAEIDKRYTEYRAKMKTDDFTYYEGMADALDLFEQFLDTLPEQPVEGLEEEIETYFKGWYMDETDQGYILHTPDDHAGLMSVKQVARHFAEWGAEHVRKEDKQMNIKFHLYVEIERRLDFLRFFNSDTREARIEENRRLLSFIDSLPDQHMEGLEEAAEKWAETQPFALPVSSFKAGAEWGAKHLKK